MGPPYTPATHGPTSDASFCASSLRVPSSDSSNSSGRFVHCLLCMGCFLGVPCVWNPVCAFSLATSPHSRLTATLQQETRDTSSVSLTVVGLTLFFLFSACPPVTNYKWLWQWQAFVHQKRHVPAPRHSAFSGWQVPILASDAVNL